MKILFNILFFVLGFIIGCLTRKVLKKFIETKKMIKKAQEIVDRENKRKEFKEKYDFSECFEEEKK